MGHDTEVLLELADTFVAIAESMIAEKMPPEDVRKRIEEYVATILGRSNGNA